VDNLLHLKNKITYWKEELKCIFSKRDFTDRIVRIYGASEKLITNKDVLFFKGIKSHTAFKYPVIKEMLTRSDVFGVSDIHLALNSIYFSKDEKRHQQNKKAALKHLEFLAKENLGKENDYTAEVFKVLSSSIPRNKKIDLNYHLINPIVFINAFKELGFFEIYPSLNPLNPSFEYEKAIKRIADYYSDTESLEIELKEHLRNGGKLPGIMQRLLDEIDDNPDQNELPKFLRSIVFTTIESSASFLGTFVYIVFTQYPELMNGSDPEKLHKVANEVLRIHTPVPFIFRTIREDTDMFNTSFKKGDLVILFLGSANMDPSVFERPFEIDVDRTEKHLSFSGGKFACIGQFASFRLAMNVLSYIAQEQNKLKFHNDAMEFFIHNSMRKMKRINVEVNEKS
jgi:hypothetical protein